MSIKERINAAISWSAFMKQGIPMLLCLCLILFSASAIIAEEETESNDKTAVTNDEGTRPKREPADMEKRFHKMLKKQVEDMTKTLELTDEQAVKITAIMEESHKEMSEKREKSRDMDRSERKKQAEAFKKSQEETDKKIKAELTEEQQKKYDEWLKEQKSRKRGHGGPGGRGERGSRG